MPFRVPYHLQREPYSNRGSRVPDFILAAGEAQARGKFSAGQAWGNAFSQAGETIGGAVARAPHEAEALEVSKSRRAALDEETQARQDTRTQDKKASEAFAQGKTRQEILARLEGNPGLYEKYANHFREIDNNLKRTLGSWAAAVRTAGDDPQHASLAVADMVDNGFNPEHLARFARQMSTKEGVTKVIDTLLRESPDEGHKALATKEPKLHNVPPGTTVIDERNPAGGSVFTAPPAPEKPPNRTTEEEYIFSKFGANPTAEQRETARAKWAALGREPDKPGDGLPPDRRRRVDQLSDKFLTDPVVRRANTVAEGYTFVSSLDPNTTNPADDQGLIYAFAKAMDPDSAVREGEYATVEKYAQSWVEKFGFDAKRVVSGTEFLTPQARVNLKATIRSKYEASRKGYDNIRTQFGKQIEQITGKADGTSYLVDYGAGMPQTQGAPGAPKAATPAASGSVSVKAPDGKTYTFATQAEADKFKRDAGIR